MRLRPLVLALLLAAGPVWANPAPIDPQIADYKASPDPWVRYQATKAEAWQAYTHHEYSERSLTDLGQFAGQEVSRLLTALAQSTPLSPVTPVPAGSGVMRRDLWATAELLKKHPAFAQVSEQVAAAEVMLVWAAAEHCELGWRHSREHFSAAERLLLQARATAELSPQAPAWPAQVSYPDLAVLNGPSGGCRGVQGSWPLPVPDFAVPVMAGPVAPEPAEVPIPEPTPAARQVAELPNVVHFALDRAALSAKSRQVLDRIAAALRQYPEMMVTLYGYTDYRASVAYNQALAARRAASVERYLQQQGIALSRMARVSKGEQNQQSDPEHRRATALSRRVELVFAQDGLEIQPRAQTEDLQLER